MALALAWAPFVCAQQSVPCTSIGDTTCAELGLGLGEQDQLTCCQTLCYDGSGNKITIERDISGEIIGAKVLTDGKRIISIMTKEILVFSILSLAATGPMAQAKDNQIIINRVGTRVYYHMKFKLTPENSRASLG